MGTIEFVNFSTNYSEIVHIIKSEIELTPDVTEIKKRVFLIELDEIGENEEANRFMRTQNGTNYFQSSQAVLVLIGSSELYTKTYAKKWFFWCNINGCDLPGHPLVELTKDLVNFKTWSKSLQISRSEVAERLIRGLVQKLSTHGPIHHKKPNMLVLHAGHKSMSNTLMLWERVEEALVEQMQSTLNITTLHVDEGQIRDCYGCSFETCSYYAMGKSCFYGGFVVEALYPSIEAADYVVWVCPNYNDAISAKLMAVINRLTALYRNMKFNEKYILGIIVSANSGNDTVASQLIGALGINKGFRVPPYFALMELANSPGEIYERKGLDERIKNYVNNMVELMNKNMV